VTAAHAEPEESIARARAYYDTGRGFYALGNYSEAVKQFAAGYALFPKPQFLIDMAQCYRKLHDRARARAMLTR
jgi:TolA-binding protein